MAMTTQEIGGVRLVCLRCRSTEHRPWCGLMAYRNGMVTAGLMQLEEAQVARRHGLSQRVVEQIGEVLG